MAIVNIINIKLLFSLSVDTKNCIVGIIKINEISDKSSWVLLQKLIVLDIKINLQNRYIGTFYLNNKYDIMKTCMQKT